jgi:hypothetical protein
MGVCLSCFLLVGGPAGSGPDAAQSKEKGDVPPLAEQTPQQVISSKTTRSISHTFDIAPIPDFIEVGSVSSGESCWTDDAYTSTRPRRITDRDKKLANIQKLEEHCPLATKEERERFLAAKDGNYDLAFKQLSAYLDWRKKYNVDSMTDLTGTNICCSPQDDDADNEITRDESDWIIASNAALFYYKERPARTRKNDGTNKKEVTILPRLAQEMVTLPESLEEPMKTNEGKRIIQLLPAQMDPNIADEDTYTLSIAFYLERKLCRNSMEQIVVCIDLRSGDNWYNPKASTLIPFIKNVTSCLGTNFPERLSKSILSPMPRIAMTLWKVLVKKFLDPNTAKKIVVIGGKASRDAETPYKKMQKYIPMDVIDQMEQARLDACERAGSDALGKVESVELWHWA